MIKSKVVNIKYDDYDVYIGRGSKWGNPYKIGKDGTRKEVIQKYEQYLSDSPNLLNSLNELKGKVLGCHCKPKSCHGDVLIKFLKYYNKKGSYMSDDNEIENEEETEYYLFDADPNCDHEVVAKWSGVECKKCGGWFCY